MTDLHRRRHFKRLRSDDDDVVGEFAPFYEAITEAKTSKLVDSCFRFFVQVSSRSKLRAIHYLMVGEVKRGSRRSVNYQSVKFPFFV